jgi:hypothetical protein
MRSGFSRCASPSSASTVSSSAPAWRVSWLYRGGRLGRDVWNLDGEIVRLTWSWKPGTTAWLVLAGQPEYSSLRQWAAIFPGTSFPTAEGAVLHRLEPGLRESVRPAGAKMTVWMPSWRVPSTI